MKAAYKFKVSLTKGTLYRWNLNRSLSCCVQITKRSSFHDYGKTMIFFISSNNRLATGVNIWYFFHITYIFVWRGGVIGRKHKSLSAFVSTNFSMVVLIWKWKITDLIRNFMTDMTQMNYWKRLVWHRFRLLRIFAIR